MKSNIELKSLNKIFFRINLFKILLNKKNKEIKRVLNNISIKTNDKIIGIIGNNGSGKSTLLKLLIQVYKPTTGTITLENIKTISSLIDSSGGLIEEISGAQNIDFYLSQQNLSNDQLKFKKNEIINFSELEDDIDKKVKFYSSGMRIRLVFSIITSIQSEFLVIDEVLSVGDEHFKFKSLGKITDLCNSAKKVIIASHDINFLIRFCEKILYLNDQKVRKFDTPFVSALSYLNDLSKNKFPIINAKASIKKISASISSNILKIKTKIHCLKKCQIKINFNVFDIDLGVNLFQGDSDLYLNKNLIIDKDINSTISFKIPQTTKRILIAQALFIKDTNKSWKVVDSWGWDNNKLIIIKNKNSKLKQNMVLNKQKIEII